MNTTELQKIGAARFRQFHHPAQIGGDLDLKVRWGERDDYRMAQEGWHDEKQGDQMGRRGPHSIE